MKAPNSAAEDATSAPTHATEEHTLKDSAERPSAGGEEDELKRDVSSIFHNQRVVGMESSLFAIMLPTVGIGSDVKTSGAAAIASDGKKKATKKSVKKAGGHGRKWCEWCSIIHHYKTACARLQAPFKAHKWHDTIAGSTVTSKQPSSDAAYSDEFDHSQAVCVSRCVRLEIV